MVRIALYGPPLAGKRTFVETVARLYGTRSRSFQQPLEGAPEAYHAGVILEIEHAHRRCRFVTLSGAVWGVGPWKPMLEEVDALLLVLDPQDTRFEANRRAIEALEHLPEVPDTGGVMVSKVDLEPKENAEALALLRDTRFSDWPVITATMARPETYLEVVDRMTALS